VYQVHDGKISWPLLIAEIFSPGSRFFMMARFEIWEKRDHNQSFKTIG